MTAPSHANAGNRSVNHSNHIYRLISAAYHRQVILGEIIVDTNPRGHVFSQVNDRAWDSSYVQELVANMEDYRTR